MVTKRNLLKIEEDDFRRLSEARASESHPPQISEDFFSS